MGLCSEGIQCVAKEETRELLAAPASLGVTRYLPDRPGGPGYGIAAVTSPCS
jgi:hypothetical protein